MSAYWDAVKPPPHCSTCETELVYPHVVIVGDQVMELCDRCMENLITISADEREYEDVWLH